MPDKQKIDAAVTWFLNFNREDPSTRWYRHIDGQGRTDYWLHPFENRWVHFPETRCEYTEEAYQVTVRPGDGYQGPEEAKAAGENIEWHLKECKVCK